MKTKISDLFFENEVTIEFNPENIDWSDVTVCVLCGKKEPCNCRIHDCPCGIPANICNWPSDNCPCPKCYESIKNCKCLIYIKKEK